MNEERLARASLLQCVGELFTYQGKWKDAEDISAQAADIRRCVLGEEHPSTLTILETRKRVLGEEHSDTLTSMANLAWTYSSQGRWKEAEGLEMQVMETKKRAKNLAVQVMEAKKRVLGEEHPDTLASMSSIAHIWKV
ncbi:hypothetical protein C7999DRAFT_42103 [Corynascus novoguineensis]|uniref:Kinesin light chain n=1 Tax=Corynascus novoguineensis TaxID=1126955 RepID=A0AAN7HME8_9PEZI|nr:hypothetical protein C7999DRAFT_42103 [Corynascus novoguineensis]